MALSLVPDFATATPIGAAWRNNINASHYARIIEGIEPREMLTLAPGTDEGKK
jgi:hypothetical protein